MDNFGEFWVLVFPLGGTIYIYDIGLHLFRPECLQGAELYVVLKVPLAPCWECTILSKKKCPPKLGWGGAVQLEDI